MSTTLARTRSGLYVSHAPPFSGPWGSDMFAGATHAVPLPSGLNTWTEALGSNAAFGVEAGEPAPTGFSSGKSAWWKIVPTRNCVLSIDTIGSGGDTEIGLWTGAAVNALALAAADSDSGGGFRSWIKGVAVAAGATYWLQVRAFNSVTMTYQVNIRAYDPAPNDLFANARPVAIAAAGGTYSDGWWDNSACAMESFEPQPTAVPTGRSAWWKYTPAASGVAQFDTIGTRPTTGTTDTEIAVYTGAAVNALAKIASDSDSGGSATSKITGLAVVAGTTYYLQVGSNNGGAMAYQVNVTGPAT